MLWVGKGYPVTHFSDEKIETRERGLLSSCPAPSAEKSIEISKAEKPRSSSRGKKPQLGTRSDVPDLKTLALGLGRLRLGPRPEPPPTRASPATRLGLELAPRSCEPRLETPRRPFRLSFTTRKRGQNRQPTCCASPARSLRFSEPQFLRMENGKVRPYARISAVFVRCHGRILVRKEREPSLRLAADSRHRTPEKH